MNMSTWHQSLEHSLKQYVIEKSTVTNGNIQIILNLISNGAIPCVDKQDGFTNKVLQKALVFNSYAPSYNGLS